MRSSLIPHPNARFAAVSSIAVDVARVGRGQLLLSYIVSGAIGALRLPPVMPPPPMRADKLWQHTCFEAFVRPGPGAAYYEFNFAPSTSWAGYGFTEYRQGMRQLDELYAPLIEVKQDSTQFDMQVALDLNAVTDLTRGAVWRVGVSAVIEEMDGGKSYWALKHPPGKPDFHHSDCFALALAPASRP